MSQERSNVSIDKEMIIKLRTICDKYTKDTGRVISSSQFMRQALAYYLSALATADKWGMDTETVNIRALSTYNMLRDLIAGTDLHDTDVAEKALKLYIALEHPEKATNAQLWDTIDTLMAIARDRATGDTGH